MHSRIFVLSKDENLSVDDVIIPFEDNGYYISPLIDYVFPSSSFKEDVQWLESVYGIQVSWKNEKAYLSDNALQLIGQRIKNNMVERLEKIQKLITDSKNGKIEVDDWLLYRIAELAWNALGFFFHVVEDGSPKNEPEFLNYIVTHNTPLWIIGTYDYHF